MDEAIVASRLVVRHGELVAVDELDLAVRPGEVLALLGPNGAGKTSAVETMEGYRRADGGEVRVLGFDPIRDRRSLAPSIGVMLQQGGVYPVMTPRQAVRLFASYYPNPEDPEALLERLGLERVAATPWRRLSGGEQQRTSLALALIGRPRVLFLDEPTAGVDLHGRHAIREVIAEQASKGVAVLVTTHELAEAEATADRVAILNHGVLATQGTVAELTGEGLHFSAQAGLDLAAMSEALGVPVRELRPGSYRVDAPTTPQLIADLGTWLAAQGTTMEALRSGASLEDTYEAIVGELADEEPPAPARRTRRRRR